MTSPVEFLYLDRGRLFSYASQLDDGLTILRRYEGTEEASTIAEPAATEHEQTKKEMKGGSVGVKFGLKAEGRLGSEETQTTRTSPGGEKRTEAIRKLQAVAKIGHDNLMLDVRRALEESGVLMPFRGDPPASGLYLFRGTLSFSDWGIVGGLLDSLKRLQSMGIQNTGLPKGADKVLKNMFEILSLTGISASMTSEQKSILAPLSDDHLQITREQLQLAFLRDGAVDAEMIAFVPTDSSESSHIKHGLMQQASFGPLFENFVGQVDYRVIPISIHIPLRK